MLEKLKNLTGEKEQKRIEKTLLTDALADHEASLAIEREGMKDVQNDEHGLDPTGETLQEIFDNMAGLEASISAKKEELEDVRVRLSDMEIEEADIAERMDAVGVKIEVSFFCLLSSVFCLLPPVTF